MHNNDHFIKKNQKFSLETLILGIQVNSTWHPSAPQAQSEHSHSWQQCSSMAVVFRTGQRALQYLKSCFFHQISIWRKVCVMCWNKDYCKTTEFLTLHIKVGIQNNFILCSAPPQDLFCSMSQSDLRFFSSATPCVVTGFSIINIHLLGY